MQDILLYVTIALLVISAGIIIYLLTALSRRVDEVASINSMEKLNALRQELSVENRLTRAEITQSIQGSIHSFGETLTASQKATAEMQDKRLAELNEQFTSRNDSLYRTLTQQNRDAEGRQNAFAAQSEQKLEAMRTTLEGRLAAMQADNEKQLEKIRITVDEKLQKTLEDRIGESFKQVSDRLEQVYKGLGEMQTLASGVGDLKKILSNVKTRGILGEVQLGAILEQILSPEQYERDVATKPNSREHVEFAIKLPGDGSGTVFLPIDAKFPGDTYSALMDAYENGGDIKAASQSLESTLKQSAKTIRDKYIEPPYTTEFAIMFLPFEGLYAQAVQLGLIETLQREYKVNIAGPTTLAALLSSLQMGFRTLAIQKRSGEVWNVLSAVKTEFEKFGGVLEATQKRLNSATDELDKLVGVRTRVIQSKLKSVTALSDDDAAALLGSADIEEA